VDVNPTNVNPTKAGDVTHAPRSNNIQTLKRLNAGRNVVVVRVDNNPPPQSLRQAAEQAAYSGDLRSMHPAGLAAHARSPWDELRV
jgi:hypothetical protein